MHYKFKYRALGAHLQQDKKGECFFVNVPIALFLKQVEGDKNKWIDRVSWHDCPSKEERILCKN